jgi:hypothetical protein
MRDTRALLDFDEVRRLLRLGTRIDVGRETIHVAQIIGSAGRAHEFDADFRPRNARLRRILNEIRANRPDAPDSPIHVYLVDEGYFVVDGHKRLALAIGEGRAYIDAEVTRYATRFHLARGTTIDEVRSTQEELRFRELTGLAGAVPDARFPLADPDAYLDLEESVKAHAYDLSLERGELVRPADAAAHWYDVIFQPAVAIARNAGFDRLLSSCSEAELFLVIRHGNRDALGPGWEVRERGVERGLRNLEGAMPAPAFPGIGRLLRRPRRRPDVLREDHPVGA